MKLPVLDSGNVTVERTLKKGKKILVQQNHTDGLGPFSREENPARVGGSVSATLARNYHSVSVMVSVNIPAHPTENGVDDGLKWCFEKANSVLNEQLRGANKALDKLSNRRD